jgi:P4 family phage/plasmid primase-like protien
MSKIYNWDKTSSPVLDLHEALNHDPESNIAVSYINESGIWNTRHVKLKYADSFIRSLNDEKNNVYVMVNEVTSLVSAHGRGDASQVTRLKALWADLDFKDSGLQDEEHANSVIEILSGMLNSEPVAIVFSGYGFQPYWEVEDGEINESNRVYMAGLLKRWGALVQRVASIEGGHVDPVYDLPRVLRAPGSFNYKVANQPVATEIVRPGNSSPISLAQVEEVLTAYGFTEVDSPDEFVVVSSPEDWEPANFDCAWAATLMDNISNGNPPARHPWMVGMAVRIESAARYGCVTEETHAQLVHLLRDKFQSLIGAGSTSRVQTHNEVQSSFVWARSLVSSFDEQKLVQAVQFHTHKLGELRAVPDLPKESTSAASTSIGSTASSTYTEAMEGSLALKSVREIAYQAETFSYTDTGNASRLAALATGSFIYVPNIGWHKWDGARFVIDESKQIVQTAIESAQLFAATDMSDAGVKWAKRSLQSAAINSAISLAETMPGVVVPARVLDSAGMELCTPNGIVELRTGELRAADPYRDFHTKQTVVAPEIMDTPLWDAFLEKVIVDEERIIYIQEVLGLALVGEVLHHVLPLFVGTGANGKSTILEVTSGILGDYVAQMPENFLLEKGHQEHSTEIARLRGARLAIGSETRPDGRFNESRVKMLTGGDTISARLIGKNFFDFKPTHTLILAMNHLPKVSAGGDGFWRRVRKINFDVTIPVEEQDKLLASKLVKFEGPGILQWMIVGAQRVLENGNLTEPESVVVATKEYRTEEDHLSQFVSDAIMVNAYSNVSGGELYAAYKAWCVREAETPVSKLHLVRELSNRLPMVKSTSSKGQRFSGIGLYEWDEAY